jgi:hypothetical protein
VDEVSRTWWWVLEQVRRQSPCTEAVLRRARLESVEGNTIVLSWPWRFHRNVIDHPARRRLVEAAVANVMGRSYSLRCVTKMPPTGTRFPVHYGHLD